MRPVLFALALMGCATTTRPHADTFIKRDFGFVGPRELTLVGPSSDVNQLRIQLRKHGFSVLEVDRVDDAKTRYVADIAGVCNWHLIANLTSDGQRHSDAELHVVVTKAETRERLFSARLGDATDCPDAFFVEVAQGIARNWQRGP